MKKFAAIILAAALAALCAIGLADNTLTTTVTNSLGSFEVSFDLLEGSEVISEGWMEGSLYQANIKIKDHEYLYLAIDGSNATAGEDGDTYDEKHGYTDELLLSRIDELYGDEYDSYEKSIVSTTHGTKIAVLRVNDPEEPMAYAWSKWNNFEIGMTLTNVNDEGEFQPITDEQMENVIAFTSEVWMHVKVNPSAEENVTELTPELKEVRDAAAWLGAQVSGEDQTKVLELDRDTVREKLEGYEAELKYYTKDTLADAIYEQIQSAKRLIEEFASAAESEPSGIIRVIIPAFDGTKWVSEDQVAMVVYQDEYYKVAIGQNFEEISNGTNALNYLCKLADGKTDTLESIGTGTEGDGQADKGEGSVFIAGDLENGVGYLKWTNADNKTVEFRQYDENFVGTFTDGESMMEIECDFGEYMVVIAPTIEDISNGTNNTVYTGYQGIQSLTLTCKLSQPEGEEEKYGYFTYDDTKEPAVINFLSSDGVEKVFTRVESK